MLLSVRKLLGLGLVLLGQNGADAEQQREPGPESLLCVVLLLRPVDSMTFTRAVSVPRSVSLRLRRYA
ncbi:hypothetical protein GCM10027048_04900 [Hymenobacter coalescens]